jgi:hypothetical protein
VKVKTAVFAILAVGLVAGLILLSNPTYVDYYRVTVKAADGEVLYDGQGRDYNASVSRGIASNNTNVGVYSGNLSFSRSNYIFEINGPGLRVTHEFLGRRPRN